MLAFLKNYIERHQHPASQALHLVGVPLTFIVSTLWLWQGYGWWALGAFVGGYALQFAGHAIEGNDAGEVVLVKKALGLPYVDIVPRVKR
ncbi:MAG TPA: Mpo1-like protein [Planctomycetaceae bacterium]|nr:Mpo1-like protein [Planctomycetaceae bacterium]